MHSHVLHGITVSQQVHFIRSVHRVAKKVNPRDSRGKDAYIALGQRIIKADSAEEVLTLFQVLKGQRPLSDVVTLMPRNDKITECSADRNEWQRATSWVEWWIRKRHLSKFHTLLDSILWASSHHTQERLVITSQL